jgi:AAA+ ATPase superfamily predicted ATPase
MFVGRKKELDDLERLYNSGRFQFSVIYGRRRVGKTALINEFIKGKRAIFFTGLETNCKQNLENFSKVVIDHAYNVRTLVYGNFQDALEDVFKMSENERLILVIDEYPYLARSCKGFASMLQVLIDRYKETSKLFLILCGSSMSFMEDQVLGYKSPLYGRRTSQFKILPFDFFESIQCFKNFSNEDMAMIYGIAGGTPQYLLQMDDRLSVEENIKSAFLNPSSYLFDEPNNLLKQEVREPALYNAVITAIANGSSKISEISNKIGEETSACSAYVKNLISLGIVMKEAPVIDKGYKKTVYALADNMFRFWYRFIPSNYSIIHNRMVDAAYNIISEQLPAYMGTVFEEISKQFLWLLNRNGKLPFTFTDAGRWWGSDPKTKTEIEMDIIATDGKDSAIFCECKWTADKIDISILNKLMDRGSQFRFGKSYYYLFSRTGFTDGCVKYSEERNDIKLISFAEMMK